MICALCGRDVESISNHHLIPRVRHNKRNRNRLTREERLQQIKICCPCHKQLHALFTEKELDYTYNTLETLLSHPDMQKFIAWIKNKPVNFVLHVKEKK